MTQCYKCLGTGGRCALCPPDPDPNRVKNAKDALELVRRKVAFDDRVEALIRAARAQQERDAPAVLWAMALQDIAEAAEEGRTSEWVAVDGGAAQKCITGLPSVESKWPIYGTGRGISSRDCFAEEVSVLARAAGFRVSKPSDREYADGWYILVEWDAPPALSLPLAPPPQTRSTRRVAIVLMEIDDHGNYELLAPESEGT